MFLPRGLVAHPAGTGGLLLVAVLVGWVASCKGARPAASAAPIDAESATVERHPDGVVIEPPPAIPSATSRAPARGVVALREPRGDEEVQKLVRALIDGFEHESIEEIMRLFSADVVQIGGRFRVPREQLVRELQLRMARADFAQLAGLDVYRPEKIQRFEFDELGSGEELARPPEMRAGDLLVKVPIDLARLNGERFFGDTMTLILRPEEGHLKIIGYAESDAQ